MSASVRVGLVGHGAIGAPLADALTNGELPGCELAGVLTSGSPAPAAVAGIDELVASSDLVVEAAGQQALRDHGPRVVEAGRELLLVSVGALVDAGLRHALAAGPGRTEVSSGAIGGLDLLRSAADWGGLDSVRLTTRKPTGSLRENWMDADLLARLERGREPVEVFDGSAHDAVKWFPRSVNVAATLALATLGWECTRVRVVADPALERNEHEIEASGPAGKWTIRAQNAPSPHNPRTSLMTLLAVKRRVRERTARLVVGV